MLQIQKIQGVVKKGKLNTVSQKGITLVALVITVIVMLILAGVAISSIVGENGIIEKTKHASDKYNNSAEKEADIINKYLDSINTVYEINYAKVSFAYEPSNWTNNAVKVSLINTLEERGYVSEYSVDNGITWNTYTTPVEINSNSTVILGRLVKLGLVGEITTGNVANIDKIAPQSFTLTQSNITEDSFTITASTTDGEATTESGISGIKEYVYYIKKSTDITYTGETILAEETSKTYTNLLQNTTYNIYVEAIDNAGNKTISSTINVTTGQIPDLTEANLLFTYTPDTWTNGTVQVGISTTIEGYTLQYSINEGSSWTNYINTIPVNSNGVILARLYKDGQTGGIATGNVANIDKIVPKAFTATSSNIVEDGFTIIASTTDGEATTQSGVSGIKEYVYYIKKSTDSTYTNTIQIGTSKTYTGLQDNTTYNIYVEAIDNAGNKTTSGTINVTTKLSVIIDGSWNTEAKVNTPDTSKLPVATTKYVTWTGSGTYTETLSSTPQSNWYDYNTSKWANIKTEANGLEAYWVWIPRFAYKLPESSTAKTIEVAFAKGKTTTVVNSQGTEETAYYATSTTITTGGTGLYKDKTATANTRWIIHPAFTFGSTQLAGIWVAKYEASSSDPSASNGGGDTTGLKVQVKPSVTSWRYITVANSFANCRAIQNDGGALGTATGNTTVDTHMIKNIEWGAVAILSQSKHGYYEGGVNKQVWNNPNSSYITGSTGSNKDQGSTADIACYTYNTVEGIKASTTGNVYGVYDMAGGAYEYVAGILSGKEQRLGTTDSKYYDLYTSSNWDDYTGGKIGDMTRECLPASQRTWNGDHAQFVHSTNPLFYRGGGHAYAGVAGVFAFYRGTGGVDASLSFRPVLVAV